MSLRRLFQFFLKNDTYMKQVHQKITDIETQIYMLKENQLKEQEQAELWQPPIVIEKIHIERLHLDKFELNNNFGQLGIKELGGTLNIGATYGVGTPYPFNSDAQDNQDKDDSQKQANSTYRKKENKARSVGPKINIKAKNEEDGGTDEE